MTLELFNKSVKINTRIGINIEQQNNQEFLGKLYFAGAMINEKYPSSELTSKIIGCAMQVHTRLGNGFQEVICHTLPTIVYIISIKIWQKILLK